MLYTVQGVSPGENVNTVYQFLSLIAVSILLGHYTAKCVAHRTIRYCKTARCTFIFLCALPLVTVRGKLLVQALVVYKSVHESLKQHGFVLRILLFFKC